MWYDSLTCGNLNHQAWIDFHKISPLVNSINPVDYQLQLAAVAQTHFVGQKDLATAAFLN